MIDVKKLESDIIAILKTVFDPEIPVDIYELGLIYEIKIDEDSNVYLKMTLTSPACPVARHSRGSATTIRSRHRRRVECTPSTCRDPAAAARYPR